MEKILEGTQWKDQANTSFLYEHQESTFKFFDDLDTNEVSKDDIKKLFYIMIKNQIIYLQERQEQQIHTKMLQAQQYKEEK